MSNALDLVGPAALIRGFRPDVSGGGDRADRWPSSHTFTSISPCAFAQSENFAEKRTASRRSPTA